MLQSLNASWTGSKITRRTISTADLNFDEFSFEENGMLSDISMDDKFSLRNRPWPPPPLSNSALSLSRSVNQDEATNDTAKPSQRQTKWELGEDETRSDTQGRRGRLRELPSVAEITSLDSLAPDKPGIARLDRLGSPPLALDNLSAPEITTLSPLDNSVNSTGHGSFDIHGNPQDALDIRRREHYSVETTTAWSISVNPTISEDLSRDDKDRGAKLRYLQKKHERKTLGLYRE